MIDETTAKTKHCLKRTENLLLGTIVLILTNATFEESDDDATAEAIKVFSEDKYCMGSDCMMWKWGIFIGEWANIGYCGLTK